jgi:hypothetical protein
VFWQHRHPDGGLLIAVVDPLENEATVAKSG